MLTIRIELWWMNYSDWINAKDKDRIVMNELLCVVQYGERPHHSLTATVQYCLPTIPSCVGLILIYLFYQKELGLYF